MSPETYWLVIPLVLLGVSGIGWLALLLTRDHSQHRQREPTADRQ